MIKKLLVANRGEIAVRIITSAKELGIKTVAVYSDFDRYSLYTKLADEAYHIGESPASKSYLRADKIIDVAKKTNGSKRIVKIAPETSIFAIANRVAAAISSNVGWNPTGIGFPVNGLSSQPRYKGMAYKTIINKVTIKYVEKSVACAHESLNFRAAFL